MFSNGLGWATTSEVSLDMVSYGVALDDVTRFWYGHGQVSWKPQTEEGVVRRLEFAKLLGCLLKEKPDECLFAGPRRLRYGRKLSTEERCCRPG